MEMGQAVGQDLMEMGQAIIIILVIGADCALCVLAYKCQAVCEYKVQWPERERERERERDRDRETERERSRQTDKMRKRVPWSGMRRQTNRQNPRSVSVRESGR